MAHARLTGLLETLSERSSRGRSRGGRYLKPDSARRHFVIHIAYEQMQRGVLPTQHDMDMLFGPAPVLGVPSTPEMQRWIDERSGWREKASTRELPASGEQTLLARYFSVGPRAATLAREGARAGRPPDYVFDFGNFEGVALKKMFLRKTLASKPSTNRATGASFFQHGPDSLGAPAPEPVAPAPAIVRWLRPKLGLGLGTIQVEAPVRAKGELRVIVDGGGVRLELDAPDDDGDATEICVPPTPAARPQSLTLTLAEIDDIKGRDGRKRLRWWCAAAIPGECSQGAGDPERRTKLKRKLQDESGTFTVSDAAKLSKYPWP